MKKFLTLTLMILAMFVFVSCVEDDEEIPDTGDSGYTPGNNDETSDGGNSGNNETPDNNNDSGNNDNNGDSGNNETPDNDNGDSGNNETPDHDNGDSGNNETPDNDNDTTPPQQECTGLSLDWSTFTKDEQYGGYYYTTGDPQLSMEFIYDDVNVKAGTFNLGSGANTNYSTCTECLRILKGEAKYFQMSGTLKIDSVDEDENIKGSLSAKFIESNIGGQDENWVSTPISGGECLEIESASFDSECIPECAGKQCGSDGCGGSCGSCDGQACSAEAQCVPFDNCAKLSFDEVELGSSDTDYGTKYYYFAEVTGDTAGSTTLADYLEIDFYSGNSYATTITEGEVTLTNDIESCDKCVILYEDVNSEGYATKLYFQESGTLNFTEVTSGMKSKGNGSFRLQEVDNHVVPVPGGKCYEVENLTWDTTK